MIFSLLIKKTFGKGIALSKGFFFFEIIYSF